MSRSDHTNILWLSHADLHIAVGDLEIAVLPTGIFHPVQVDRHEAIPRLHEDPLEPRSHPLAAGLNGDDQGPVEDPGLLAKAHRAVGRGSAKPLEAYARIDRIGEGMGRHLADPGTNREAQGVIPVRCVIFDEVTDLVLVSQQRERGAGDDRVIGVSSEGLDREALGAIVP